MSSNRTLALGLLGVLLLGSGPALGAATITIVNGDPAGVGFNDATAVAPVGGNTGTTLGAQRLIAFQAAANKWGATLTSAVPIRVYATWEALTCTATSAVLGSAGALYIYVDTPGATPTASTERRWRRSSRAPRSIRTAHSLLLSSRRSGPGST